MLRKAEKADVHHGDELPPAGLVDVKLWQVEMGEDVPMRLKESISTKKIIATEKSLKGKDIAFDAE